MIGFNILSIQFTLTRISRQFISISDFFFKISFPDFQFVSHTLGGIILIARYKSAFL